MRLGLNSTRCSDEAQSVDIVMCNVPLLGLAPGLVIAWCLVSASASEIRDQHTSVSISVSRVTMWVFYCL